MPAKARTSEECSERVERALDDVWKALNTGDERARYRTARRYLDANRELAANHRIDTEAAIDNEHDWLRTFWEDLAIDEESPPPQPIADFIEWLGRRLVDVIYRAENKRRAAAQALPETAASAARDSR